MALNDGRIRPHLRARIEHPGRDTEYLITANGSTWTATLTKAAPGDLTIMAKHTKTPLLLDTPTGRAIRRKVLEAERARKGY